MITARTMVFFNRRWSSETTKQYMENNEQKQRLSVSVSVQNGDLKENKTRVNFVKVSWYTQC